MQQIAMAIHGGADPDSDFIKENKEDYTEGLKNVITAGKKCVCAGCALLAGITQASEEMLWQAMLAMEEGTMLMEDITDNFKNSGEIEAAISSIKKRKKMPKEHASFMIRFSGKSS